MTVHKNLGNGFLESVYQEALEKELQKTSIPFERQKKLQVRYEDDYLDKYFIADFICYDKIIIELKAVSFINNEHTSQILNYMKVTGYQVGLLINFGQSSLVWKRYILTPNKSVLIRVPRGWISPDKYLSLYLINNLS